MSLSMVLFLLCVAGAYKLGVHKSKNPDCISQWMKKAWSWMNKSGGWLPEFLPGERDVDR